MYRRLESAIKEIDWLIATTAITRSTLVEDFIVMAHSDGTQEASKRETRLNTLKCGNDAGAEIGLRTQGLMLTPALP